MMVWLIQLEANMDLIIIEHVILFENLFVVFAVETFTFSQFCMKYVDVIS